MGGPFSPIIIRLLPLSCRCLHCLCVSGFFSHRKVMGERDTADSHGVLFPRRVFCAAAAVDSTVDAEETIKGE